MAMKIGNLKGNLQLVVDGTEQVINLGPLEIPIRVDSDNTTSSSISVEPMSSKAAELVAAATFQSLKQSRRGSMR